MSDPQETKNLAASEPAITARLRQLIASQPEAKPQVKDSKADSNSKKKNSCS
ncbi:MAG: hypothetical protein H8M99_02605 [Gloeobacteraceae cyanobacterium ES-bin-144]|nr:hypothetical protein [Verrucomicrobiales bacterium]